MRIKNLKTYIKETSKHLYRTDERKIAQDLKEDYFPIPTYHCWLIINEKYIYSNEIQK